MRTTHRRFGHVLLFLIVFSAVPALLVAQVADPEAEEEIRFPAFEAAAIEGAYLELDRGIPVAHVWGNPRERGRRLGELLKPQVRHMVLEYIHGFFTEEGLDNAYPVALGLEPEIPRYLYEEMKGIAEGADLEYRDVLLANCWIDAFARIGCSAFLAEAPRSSTGKLLLARNLDWPLIGSPQDGDFLLVIHPDEGPATLLATWPGLVGAVTGMNESGLSLAMLVSFQAPPRLVGTPNVLAYRALLDTAADLEAVIPFFDDMKVIAPNSLMLADATGTGRVVELDPYFQGYSNREAEDGVLICTNIFRIGSQQAPADWRYQSLQQFAGEKRRHTFLDARRYMQRVAPNQGRLLANIQSTILEPENRTVYLSAKEVPAAGGKFLRFEVGAMFDIEEPSTGDASEAAETRP